MAQITGTVNCLQVADNFALTTIRDTITGDTETLILWFAPGTGNGIPETLTSFTRILHSTWVSQLRDAHTNNLTVTVIHPDASAAITAVRLGTL